MRGRQGKKEMLPTRVELMISTLLVWRLTNLAIEAFLENKQKRMEYTVQLDAPKTRWIWIFSSGILKVRSSTLKTVIAKDVEVSQIWQFDEVDVAELLKRLR